MNLKIIIITFLSLFLVFPQLKAESKKAKIIFSADLPIINNQITGGYAELATLLNQVRQSNETSFFLFGGGSIGPSPMSSFDRGSHIIDILNMLEPDAMGLTKSEFSYFEDELSFRSYEAAFPFISSNLFFSGVLSNINGIQDHKIIEKEGIKLGVISVLDPTVITEYLLKNIEITPPLSVIRTQAKELRSMGANSIVLMYSYGFPFITELLNEKIIDIALLTNSHFELSEQNNIPDHANSIYLSERGSVAIIDLLLHKEEIKVSWDNHKLTDYPPNSEINKHILNYVTRLDRLLDEQVGITTTRIDTRREVVRSKESAFANFITDSLRTSFNADIAMINGGAIRGDKIYPPNTPLYRRDITLELPFRTQISIIEVTGIVLKKAIENGLSQIENNKGRFLHFSGVNLVYDSSAQAGQRLISLKINQNLVQDNKTYRVVTSDYLANGGDDFRMLANSSKAKLTTRVSPLLTDVVINSIRQKRELSPKIEQRLVDIAKEALHNVE